VEEDSLTSQKVLPQGYEVIEETVQLLRQIQFSADEGGYAEGEYVGISVYPRWNEDQSRFSAIITCHAFGHQQVDWSCLLVVVKSGDGALLAPLRLNSRGQAIKTGLEPGDYRVSAFELAVVTPPVPLHQEGPWDRVYPSEDDRFWMRVGRRETGELVVAAATRDPGFSGATVRFSFLLEGTKVMQPSGELTLEPSKEQENLWVGYRVYPSELKWAAAAAEEPKLFFCMLPQQSL
jgi:hypothetical protein